MKCSLYWRGSQEVNLHALLPNKFLRGFTEVTEGRLNSGTKIFHLLSHSTCKPRNREKKITMAEELIELKFRIYGGTDIAHNTYASSVTVATLKQKIVAEWPREKSKDDMQKLNSCGCTIL